MPEESSSRFTLNREDLLSMDPIEFRARFRERVHHTLEIQTYAAIHHKKILPERQTETTEVLMKIWEERGLPTDLPDFLWVKELLSFAKEAQAGRKVDLSRYTPHEITEEGLEAIRHLLFERRSVRHWTDEEVPDSIIDQVLEAAMWAPHSCNLQSIRYAVIREAHEPGLFRKGPLPKGLVHILVLQDEHVYRANLNIPIRNRLLDVGAAVQNMVLAAHSLGLGGVWLTLTDEMIQRLYKRINPPEEVKIITYVDIGFPAQTPAPPRRISLSETVLVKI